MLARADLEGRKFPIPGMEGSFAFSLLFIPGADLPAPWNPRGSLCLGRFYTDLNRFISLKVMTFLTPQTLVVTIW